MPIGQSVRERMIFYFVHRTQKKAFIIDFRLVDNTLSLIRGVPY